MDKHICQGNEVDYMRSLKPKTISEKLDYLMGKYPTIKEEWKKWLRAELENDKERHYFLDYLMK